MKKVIVFSLSLFIFGALTADAQTQATSAETAKVVSKTADKTPVKKEALPEAITKALGSEEYKSWEFTNASLVKEEGKEYYEINLKQADKTVLVKLTAEGKKVD